MSKPNVYDTIGYMLSLIHSPLFDASVNTLSEACALPVEKTRKTIERLYDNRILKQLILPENDEENQPDDDLYADTDNALYDILNGEANDKLINMENFDAGAYTADNSQDYFFLPLNAMELGYLKNEYPDIVYKNSQSVFEIKDSLQSLPKEILEKEKTIAEAIEDNHKIQFHYRKAGKENSIICSPAAVQLNRSSEYLYLKDSNNEFYRLDRIMGNITTLKEESDIKNTASHPMRKYYWGTEFKDPGSPQHVKLKIFPDTGNIISKISFDTSHRRETRKLYEHDGVYYYEDDILGIAEFRRWLRGYGSSVIVLEPAWLAEKIAERAKLHLSFYEELDSIDSSIFN